MPKKTLEEMLADNVVSPGAKEATKRLATFLKYWDEIEAAHKKGWPWLQIYNALHQEGVIDYSYSTFLHYKDRKRRKEFEAANGDRGTKGACPERQSRTPGSTKVDLPTYGESTRQRDGKRF